MHCNVLNYNKILFLVIIGVVMQRNCVENAIVLSGNKHFPGGVHYPGAIFRVTITWEYISVVNCSRANYLRDNFRGSNFRGGGGGGRLNWGAIVWGANILGGYCLRGNYPGDNCPVPC